MTPDEILIAGNLGNCKFLPGSWNKRFVNNLHYQAKNKPELELTASQKEWLYRLLYTYRNQIPKIYDRFKDNPFCKKLKR